jgi:hypothetical protein
MFHAELAGPKVGQQQVRPAVGLETDHVVRRNLGPEDGIAQCSIERNW